jgi:hypothetical protein
MASVITIRTQTLHIIRALSALDGNHQVTYLHRLLTFLLFRLKIAKGLNWGGYTWVAMAM